ncbi:hypothetical protein BC833DRAFT_609747 [Globomyces pollinis-pini]|nr:hypothetical protein BC833DRAFT_609747 [Globomyces pollinis-pini]
MEISDLTAQLQSFTNAQFVDGCLQSINDTYVPFPQNEIKKIFVRKCYEDVFDLLLNNIKMKSFAVSGTSGIGKSLFFVYILYRLIKDFKMKTLPLKPNHIVYQISNQYFCFDLEKLTVVVLERLEAKLLVLQQLTFYIIDGETPPILTSSCIVLFISSCRQQEYDRFVEEKMAKEWHFPVWDFEELKACQSVCYQDLSLEVLKTRYRIYGGIARWIFYQDYSIIGTNAMVEALADIDAVKKVHGIGIPTTIFGSIQTLVHMIVSTDGLYRFTHVDLASKYVGEQLWIHYSTQMITNLNQLFGGIPRAISRHLFESYGNRVFLNEGGRTLNCRCLEDATVDVFILEALNIQPIEFGQDNIPTAEELMNSYYERTDKDDFLAVDSLSPQGMFKFTDAAEHPIREVNILRKMSKLYDEPKLYFVFHLIDFKRLGNRVSKQCKAQVRLERLRD